MRSHDPPTQLRREDLRWYEGPWPWLLGFVFFAAIPYGMLLFHPDQRPVVFLSWVVGLGVGLVLSQFWMDMVREWAEEGIPPRRWWQAPGHTPLWKSALGAILVDGILAVGYASLLPGGVAANVGIVIPIFLLVLWCPLCFRTYSHLASLSQEEEGS